MYMYIKICMYLKLKSIVKYKLMNVFVLIGRFRYCKIFEEDGLFDLEVL